MEKSLLTKVKILLQNCNPENVDSIKSKIMINLKPSEAEEVYEYFTRIEPTFIKENYKVQTSQVIPLYSDYYTDTNAINDIFLDEYTDQD